MRKEWVWVARAWWVTTEVSFSIHPVWSERPKAWREDQTMGGYWLRKESRMPSHRPATSLASYHITRRQDGMRLSETRKKRTEVESPWLSTITVSLLTSDVEDGFLRWGWSDRNGTTIKRRLETHPTSPRASPFGSEDYIGSFIKLIIIEGLWVLQTERECRVTNNIVKPTKERRKLNN